MAHDADGDQSRRRRMARWLTPSVVVVLAAAGLLAAFHLFQDSSSSRVGACFQTIEDTSIVATGGLREVSGRVVPVDCGGAHNGVIVRVARRSSDCAAEGAWLNSRERIYCVTLSA